MLGTAKGKKNVFNFLWSPRRRTLKVPLWVWRQNCSGILSPGCVDTWTGSLLGWPSFWRIILIMAQQKPTGTAAWGLSVPRKPRIWRRQRLKGAERGGRVQMSLYTELPLFFGLQKIDNSTRSFCDLMGPAFRTNGKVTKKQSQWYCERSDIICHRISWHLISEWSCWICGTSY